MAARLHPHIALRAGLAAGLLKHLHHRFIDVDDGAIEQRIAHQVVPRLQLTARTDDPALARRRRAMALEYVLEAGQ